MSGWGNQNIPHSQEAEEAVLGAILVNPGVYTSVAAFLKADDFFILRHKYIWQALERLAERNEAIDLLTVAQSLREINKLGDIGGPAYLTQLVNACANSQHAEVYGRLVERTATRRRLMTISDEIKALAQNEELRLEDVIEQSNRKLFDASGMRSEDRIIPFQAMVSEYFDRVEYLIDHPTELIGLSTGFKDLDHLLEGLQKTDLLLLAGRPGMGKSSLLLTIVMNILRIAQERKQKKRIAYFSLEMGCEQLVQRAASLEAGINLQTLRAGRLNSEEWSKFVEASGKIASYPLFIDDRPRITPRQLRARLRNVMMGYGRFDLVVVDYVQLMTGGGFKPSERVQEVSFISHSLKNIAKEFDVPVLAAAQLSRAVEQRADKRPQLSDLRESGGLEADADVVMFVYRDEVYNPASEFPNQADIIVAKHRNGPTGTVTLYFEKTLTKFMNAAERTIDLSYLGTTPVPATPYDPSEKD